MINKQTIISAYDEKLTLVQWLKLVNKALDEAVLTNVEIAQRGNATFVFVFTFEDGTQVESNEIIVNQGESIVGATIQNGHLLLTLSNDDVLDAGNVKPVSSFSFNAQRHLIVSYADGTTQDLGLIKGVSGFSINANQHLIVTYDNGTTEDLGAIFDGNVNIDGTLKATYIQAGSIEGIDSNDINIESNIIVDDANITLTDGHISTPIITTSGNKIEALKPIVEAMSGYSFTKGSNANFTYDFIYAGIVKNGNKLTCVVALNLTMNIATTNNIVIGYFNMPSDVASKLYPTQIGTYAFLDVKEVPAYSDFNQNIMLKSYNQKSGNSSRLEVIVNNMEVGTKYYIRYEITFLLSDNLASE